MERVHDPRRGLAAILLLGTLAAPARADEPVRSQWTALASGLWYRSWSIDAGEDSPATGHAFRADPRAVRLTVLDARRDGRRAARVDALREESGAYLVVNGGFFDEQNRPLGLLVGDGRERSPLRKVDQGVFFIAEGRPMIQHTRDPLPWPLETAIQAGPRLVVDGRALQLKQQQSRRTSICLPGDGNVIIVVFPAAVSLADLAEHLVKPPASGGLGCWAALNLDGGPSTQASLSTPAMALEVHGGWPVPDALAVLPR